ncbi:LAQU0S22e00606g1_1 [Lachancea quebecensis]|uniref:LAQU0S22e00606g1_1 n=1 Tax=Lachancea quebecensis TaxID=1654605 RepID=A0A0P1KXJ5_9SACH|nr:LAQU0S22e00606g1_1 [Lachancea quebecensis]
MLKSAKPLGLRSFANRLSISDEVRSAVSLGKPVVALESTIITHGLPFPQNVQMAKKVESIIRENNAIPATIAFMNGIPKIGLSLHEIEELAGSAGNPSINKVSRRDIAYTMANNLLGGTTISSTMILAHMAGIKIFATGGLGGVHRGAEITMDISADLEELGKTPVAVVCAGPKAILDIEKTMEFLETKGCMVATLGPAGVKVPGFYCRESKVVSPYNFESFEDAARIIESSNQLGLHSGSLFCIPPPPEVALKDTLIEAVIDKASNEADKLGIKGKQLTPFLLAEIARETNGLSVSSNIDFVMNNAKAGSQIACELSKLQSSIKNPTYFQPSEVYDRNPIDEHPCPKKLNVAVVGAIALDTHCTSLKKVRMADSNPGKIDSAIGGVGYNVALAAQLSNRHQNISTSLISSLGNDLSGSAIREKMKLNQKSIYRDDKNPTAQYLSVHSTGGELVVACSDMDIIARMPPSYVSDRIESLAPKVVIADANVSIEVLNLLMVLQEKLEYKLIFEPTSDTKARKLSELSNLRPYPNHKFYAITPTVSELKSIFEAFERAEKFDVNNWFPVLDSLQIDTAFKRLRSTENSAAMQKFTNKGILQMACSLLPYFPNMLIKDGANGLFLVTLKDCTSDMKRKASLANFSFLAEGLQVEGGNRGVLFEHYEVPEKSSVKNVTGAGDTLLGVLSNEICSKGDLFDAEPLLRYECTRRAQLGAKLTVEDCGAVSEDLAKLP